MIYLSEIIIRLRTKCPSFGRRVGGTATFAGVSTALESKTGQSSDLDVPHCFVTPEEEINITGQDQYIGDDTERRREVFSTYLCVDNTVDRGIAGSGVMKFEAMDELRKLQGEIQEAFNDWVPRQKFDVIKFVRGEYLFMDNYRLWHRFDWSTDYVAVLAGDTEQINDIIEGIIRDVTEDDGHESPGDIKKIVVGYEPDRTWIETPATVQDFFTKFTGTGPVDPPVPEPNATEIQTAEVAADTTILFKDGNEVA